MSAVAADAPPPDLLKAATALGPDQFDHLVDDLLKVRAGRRSPRVEPEEAALLARVNAGPPA